MSKRNGHVVSGKPTHISNGDLRYFTRLKEESGLLPALRQQITVLQATYQRIESAFNHYGQYLAEVYELDLAQDRIGDDGEILRAAPGPPRMGRPVTLVPEGPRSTDDEGAP